MKIPEDDIKKVNEEINQLQGRILQTLVPTILAFGLIAFAASEQISYLSLGGAFAVLFASSLYVANCSYKIFRNAVFLRVFPKDNEDQKTISYEKLTGIYRDKGYKEPMIINAETTTAAIIYGVLSIIYFFIFFMERGDEMSYLIPTIITTIILLGNSVLIYSVYLRRNNSAKKWEEVKKEALNL